MKEALEFLESIYKINDLDEEMFGKFKIFSIDIVKEWR